MQKIRTHYDNLKIANNAPESVIKAAYKALSQTYHPDKYQGSKEEAERIMRIINASYAILIDPVKRAEHDAWINDQKVKNANDTSNTDFEDDTSFESVNTNQRYQTRGNSNSRTTASTTANTYDSVGGWLSILWIGLMIPFPVSYFGSLSIFRTIAKYSNYPSLTFPSLAYLGLTFGVGCFSFVAGYYLWKRRQNAVKIAKAFLLTVCAYSIFWPFILNVAADIPEDFYHDFHNNAFQEGINTFLYAIIWYAYLSLSKRVKATYSPELQSPDDNYRGLSAFIVVNLIFWAVLVYRIYDHANNQEKPQLNSSFNSHRKTQKVIQPKEYDNLDLSVKKPITSEDTDNGNIEEKNKHEDTYRKLILAYPDLDSIKNSDEFKKWIKTLPEFEQNKMQNTWEADYLIDKITLFKQIKAKHTLSLVYPDYDSILTSRDFHYWRKLHPEIQDQNPSIWLDDSNINQITAFKRRKKGKQPWELKPPVIFPFEADKLKSYELGDAIYLLMPDKNDNPLKWRRPINASILWSEEDYEANKSRKMKINSTPYGLIRINVKGEISSLFTFQLYENAWLIREKGNSIWLSGSISPDEACFDKLEDCYPVKDGDQFDPRESLKHAGITFNKVCEHRHDYTNDFEITYQISHPNKKSIFAIWTESSGSSGISDYLSLEYTDNTSGLCGA